MTVAPITAVDWRKSARLELRDQVGAKGRTLSCEAMAAMIKWRLSLLLPAPPGEQSHRSRMLWCTWRSKGERR
jgi:hypothetical protein